MSAIKAFKQNFRESTIINIDDISTRKFAVVLFKPNLAKKIVYRVDIETPSKEQQKHVTIVTEQSGGIINCENISLNDGIFNEDNYSFNEFLEVVDSVNDNQLYIIVSESNLAEKKILFKLRNLFEYCQSVS